MRRRSLFFILFVALSGGLFGQLPGVSWNGVVSERGAVYVDRHGDRVEYPSLNHYGHILRYAPLVVMDSVRVSDTLANSVQFYGNVVFDGWSPVQSCGFDYAATSSFSEYQRVVCVADEGRMTSGIAGLAFNQQYYVRSFASNRYGTSFADTLSFHTMVGPVEIESAQATVEGPYAFTLEVLLRERGGSPVYGVVEWFTDDGYQTLALADSIGSFNSNSMLRPFTGLNPATTYYLSVSLTNGTFSDTVRLSVRTPSDLVLSIESDKASSVSLCTGGTPVTYKAVLSGTDPNRPLYDFLWTSSVVDGIGQDTLFSVLYGAAGTYGVTVKAVYGEDTIVASRNQVVIGRSGSSSFYVCTNEFLNKAEATMTNIASIRWLDRNMDTVATTGSVKLPTGYYTVECTDNYGCVLSKEVYVGKKQLSCTVSEMPDSHESARYENGVWKIDSISDEDGIWYAVTQIGDKCWLRQNLRTRHLPSTHQDILAVGGDMAPGMLYMLNTSTTAVYDPETTPYFGAGYNWSAALDVSTYSRYSSYYSFSRQRQGICPTGWHIPNKDEVWEMVGLMLDICCEGETYYPPLGIENQYIAQNTPIKDMVLASCYDSYSSPAYPEEIYDASNLSFPREMKSNRFWMVDLQRSDNAAFVFIASTGKVGVSLGIGVRYGEMNPVRCVRNYPEE